MRLSTTTPRRPSSANPAERRKSTMRAYALPPDDDPRLLFLGDSALVVQSSSLHGVIRRRLERVPEKMTGDHA